MPKEKVAFVLGGGGARGALQVGALRALLEANIVPHLLAGTSAGALNAAAWATYGTNMAGLLRLEQAWRDARSAALFPQRTWTTLTRALFRRVRQEQQERLREFLVRHGMSAEMRFRDFRTVDVRLVAADVYAHKMRIYGECPEDPVLEGLLASTALLPWFPLVEAEGHRLMDGGIVSNVPIQVALKWGATHIIALDIHDSRIIPVRKESTTALLLHLSETISRRQVELEMELARAQQVKVTYVHLLASRPVALWDFDAVEDLLEEGYKQMQHVLASGKVPTNAMSKWRSMAGRLRHWLG